MVVGDGFPAPFPGRGLAPRNCAGRGTVELIEGRFPAGGGLAYGETVCRTSHCRPCPDFRNASRASASGYDEAIS